MIGVILLGWRDRPTLHLHPQNIGQDTYYSVLVLETLTVIGRAQCMRACETAVVVVAVITTLRTSK